MIPATPLPSPDAARRKVLIATQREAEFLRHFGGRRDIELHVEHSGARALDYWKSTRAPLVFCDVGPLADGYTGYRLALRVRSHASGDAAPAIYLMSPNHRVQMSDRALESLGIVGVTGSTPRDIEPKISPRPASGTRPGFAHAHSAWQESSHATEAMAIASSTPPTLGLAMEACHRTLIGLIGPIGAALIERAHPEEVVAVGDLRRYVDRLADLIVLQDVRAEFVRATRHIQV